MTWGTNALARQPSYAGTVTTSPTPLPSLDSDDALALDRQVCFALAVAARNVIAVYRPV